MQQTCLSDSKVDLASGEVVPVILNARLLFARLMAATKVLCKCGNEIDIAGIESRIGGIDVYCIVCGTVTNHSTS